MQQQTADDSFSQLQAGMVKLRFRFVRTLQREIAGLIECQGAEAHSVGRLGLINLTLKQG
jgi:hypothetical protein